MELCVRFGWIMNHGCLFCLDEFCTWKTHYSFLNINLAIKLSSIPFTSHVPEARVCVEADHMETWCIRVMRERADSDLQVSAFACYHAVGAHVIVHSISSFHILLEIFRADCFKKAVIAGMHKHASVPWGGFFILNMWHDHSKPANAPRSGMSPVGKVIFV